MTVCRGGPLKDYPPVGLLSFDFFYNLLMRPRSVNFAFYPLIFDRCRRYRIYFSRSFMCFSGGLYESPRVSWEWPRVSCVSPEVSCSSPATYMLLRKICVIRREFHGNLPGFRRSSARFICFLAKIHGKSFRAAYAIRRKHMRSAAKYVRSAPIYMRRGKFHVRSGKFHLLPAAKHVRSARDPYAPRGDLSATGKVLGAIAG